MRSHWPTAISTEPPCTQLTPSSANEHVENADTRGAEIAQNEPLPIDPLENEIGQNRKATNLEPSFRSAPIPVVCGMAMEPPGSTHLRHPAFTFGTVLHAPKRTPEQSPLYLWSSAHGQLIHPVTCLETVQGLAGRVLVATPNLGSATPPMKCI